MEKKYDVILVGAGPAGIFCAYELITKNKNLKVLSTSFSRFNDFFCRFRQKLVRKFKKKQISQSGKGIPRPIFAQFSPVRV